MNFIYNLLVKSLQNQYYFNIFAFIGGWRGRGGWQELKAIVLQYTLLRDTSRFILTCEIIRFPFPPRAPFENITKSLCHTGLYKSRISNIRRWIQYTSPQPRDASRMQFSFVHQLTSMALLCAAQSRLHAAASFLYASWANRFAASGDCPFFRASVSAWW